VEKSLKTLIDQLRFRAVGILKRLVDIVDKMVAVQKLKKCSQATLRGNSLLQLEATFSSFWTVLSASQRVAQSGTRVNTGMQESKFVLSEDCEFPYFIHNVKLLFMNFVDEVAQDCHNKCQDEFFCTQIIYWDMAKCVPACPNPSTSSLVNILWRISFSQHNFPKNISSDIYEQKDEVVELSRILFKEIRERVATNVLLKFHNFFFVPM